MLVRARPTAPACNDAKVRKPPIAASEVKKPIAGGTDFQWISRAGPSTLARGDRVSAIPMLPAIAIRARAAPPDQAATYPIVFNNLTQRWTEGKAKVEPERVVAECLTHPARWREVGQGGEGGDEERSLRDPQHQTQGDHKRHGVNEGRRQCGDRTQRGAADEKRPSAASVGETPGEGTQQQRGDGERAEGKPRAGLVGPQRPGDVERQRVDRHAGGGEVGKVHERQP